MTSASSTPRAARPRALAPLLALAALLACQRDPAPSPDRAPDLHTADLPPADAPAPDDLASPDLPDAAPACASDNDCGDGEICAQSQCVTGCRDPGDCPPDATCRAARCVPVGCRLDADCGRGHRCRDDQCALIGAAPCAQDGDCGLNWRCSDAGACVETCALHPDCPEGQWCREGVCRERRLDVGPVAFQRLLIKPFTAHVSAFPEDDCCGCAFCEKVEGFGGALLDFDGDRDLDLFLGSRVPGQGSPPCLYRNDSTPGQPRLTPVEALCGPALDGAMTGAGLDLDNDGLDELLLLGPRHARLVRFHPAPAITDLLALLPPDDPRRRCVAGAALATDLDHDGLQDVLIGCQLDRIAPCCAPQDFEGQANLALRQTPDGALRPWDDPDAQVLANEGVSLAIGGLDVNQDGLLDLLLANDTFSRRDSPSNNQDPGGLLLACAPTEPCRFRLVPFGPGSRAWGSFMGFGNVAVDGQGELLYLTDWGPNRLLRCGPDGCEDLATDLGVELATDGQNLLFAWSAIVDDFDRNGLDDLYLSQGITWPGDVPEGQAMHDALLLQRADGNFLTLAPAQVGLSEHSYEDARAEDHPRGPILYSARGAAKADLDGDGRLELLTAGLLGVVRAHTEGPPDGGDPPRCTLIPRGRYVPAWGHGVAVAGADRAAWRRRDMQGQMRFGGSPWVLTEHRQGWLRFPSGAEVAWDCGGGAGPVEVIEPDWVALDLDSGELQIALTAPWLPEGATVEVALRDADGAVALIPATPRGPGLWSAPWRDRDRALMLRLQGRWLPRWFAPTP